MERDFGDGISSLLAGCSEHSDDFGHDVTVIDRAAGPLADPEPVYWWPRFDSNGVFAEEIFVSEQDWGRHGDIDP